MEPFGPLIRETEHRMPSAQILELILFYRIGLRIARSIPPRRAALSVSAGLLLGSRAAFQSESKASMPCLFRHFS